VSGQKGRSGGSRSKAGRLPQVFHLKKEAARELSILTGHKQALRANITEQEVLEELIHAAWYDLDQHYQEMAQEVVAYEQI
jgi:hypothetical protein